uniref:EB domain-containing protein n=1 Tax=Globodera pallida TaxID=36090 RepID=A0A183BRW1_GLOPA
MLQTTSIGESDRMNRLNGKQEVSLRSVWPMPSGSGPNRMVNHSFRIVLISFDPQSAPPIAALPPPPLAPIPPPPPAPAGRLIPQALPGAPCEPGVECTGGSVCSMGICLCPPELVQEGTVCVSRTIYGVVPPPGGLPPLPAVPAFAPPPPAPVVQFAPAPFPGFAAAAPAFPMVAAAPPPAPVCPPPFRAACVARRTEPRHGGLRETKKAKTIAATEQRRPTHLKTHTDLPPQQQQPDEEDILYTLADDDPNSLNSNSVEQSVEWSRKRR